MKAFQSEKILKIHCYPFKNNQINSASSEVEGKVLVGRIC